MLTVPDTTCNRSLSLRRAVTPADQAKGSGAIGRHGPYTGQHTVAAVLRVMGVSHDRNYVRYHPLPSRE